MNMEGVIRLAAESSLSIPQFLPNQLDPDSFFEGRIPPLNFYAWCRLYLSRMFLNA